MGYSRTSCIQLYSNFGIQTKISSETIVLSQNGKVFKKNAPVPEAHSKLEDVVSEINQRYVFKYSDEGWETARNYFANNSLFYRGFVSSNTNPLNFFEYLLGNSTYEPRSWQLDRLIEKYTNSGLSNILASKVAKELIEKSVTEKLLNDGPEKYVEEETFATWSGKENNEKNGTGIWFTPLVEIAHGYAQGIAKAHKEKSILKIILTAKPNPRRFIPSLKSEVIGISHIPPDDATGAFFSIGRTNQWYYSKVEKDAKDDSRYLKIFKASWDPMSADFTISDQIGIVFQKHGQILVTSEVTALLSVY